MNEDAIDAAKERLKAAEGARVRTEWNAVEKRYELILDGLKGDAKGMRWQARCEQTITGVRWLLNGDLAKAVDIVAKRPSGLTAYQIAYAALWQIQSSTPALHDARKHILGVIGGRGSDGQKAALSWALSCLPQPMDIDWAEAKECWDELSIGAPESEENAA